GSTTATPTYDFFNGLLAHLGGETRFCNGYPPTVKYGTLSGPSSTAAGRLDRSVARSYDEVFNSLHSKV
ncbi:MAG: hypothetical protein KKE86_10870, partial [Planctomycetes bacterium]|nr:hypothetical protein [Planctomycetota bacterium]